MGLVRDVGEAAIGAAFPGAGAAMAAGGKGRKGKRGDAGSTDTDDPGAPGQGTGDVPGQDPSYVKRFGQNLAKRYSDPRRT